jgi:hypothetical protein
MIDDFLTALVQEQGYETLDEYLDRKPYVSKPEKHMLLSVKCSQCSYEHSDEYRRQNPDILVIDQWCPWCHADVVLVSAIPNTVYFHSHSTKHASFSDKIAGECWQCGRKPGQLLRYTFSNGEQVELCPTHFKQWHKDMWRFTARRRATIAQAREERSHELRHHELTYVEEWW